MEWLRRKGSSGRQWSNGEITARVEGAFSHYGTLESVEYAFIHIRTEHRVVELRGNVASRVSKMKAALSNSFRFGGHNATLIFKSAADL